ncbi:hypothetical protein GUITHDRAFT_118968 [Guillardia theta CCMP2712]|uniref:Uncharacterized protein n=1 Tax=Guillardia theta (strain CCMP2712) TaxID=905079 RepID=L1IFH0_GUITC|nr:hypothetical protein GUITHDRAFT_118968 [Guillardia theta CCMP2712]EKX34797.1 hypothetical protein GUITHDRAFT_118968 [Guillardia theta CCMP2712]|eukprot:XP_005821777.1 hypothetical protein GUITHDRAFT_118968 [Guillardia theta CCMP2712]
MKPNFSIGEEDGEEATKPPPESSGDNPMRKSPIQCVFVFRRPVMLSDRIIKLMTGPFAHVDLYVHREEKPNDSPSLTTFMGEHFSMSVNMRKSYNSRDYEGLHLRLDPVESTKLFDYAIDLVERRVPYNLADLLYQPLKTVLPDSGFFEDVPNESSLQVKKVFCSQAFVLALRNSLHNDELAGALIDESPIQRKKLLWRLISENSRLCTPSDLYHIIRPHCRRVDMDRLRHGHLSYT